MGKGSNRRPSRVSKEEYERRWVKTFTMAPTMTDLMVPPESIGDLPDTTPEKADAQQRQAVRS